LSAASPITSAKSTVEPFAVRSTSYDETLASMRLFTHEVYPRLKELTASYDPERMQGLRAGQPDREFVELGAFAAEFVR
jgi:hypothetical protein